MPNLKSMSYEDMKVNAKCRKKGGLGSYRSFTVTGNNTIQHSACEFLLAFIVLMSIFCIVSEIQQNIGQKRPILTYSHLYLAPVGGDLIEISPISLASENYSPSMLCSVVCVILCLVVLAEDKIR